MIYIISQQKRERERVMNESDFVEIISGRFDPATPALLLPFGFKSKGLVGILWLPTSNFIWID